MSDQPDVKCECGHEAEFHVRQGCAVSEAVSPVPQTGFFRPCPCNKSEADILRAAYAASEAALAERDATITFLRGELAEARADYDDVLRERNEARAEVERLEEIIPKWDDGERVSQETFDILLQQQQNADAEVERLTLALQDEDQVCDALTVTCKSCDGAGSFNDNRGCHDCVGRGYTVRDVFADIAAERQRIAEWYAGAHCRFTANGQAPCLIVKHPDEWCSHCKDAYRIASGSFAATEDVRDGE